MSSERLTTIRAAAERVAQSYDLEIFDVQLRRESIGTVLRVTIDRPDRGVPERPEDAVGITECQRVSQDLSAILESSRTISSNWVRRRSASITRWRCRPQGSIGCSGTRLTIAASRAGWPGS